MLSPLEQAKAELVAEDFRDEVDACKQHLKERRGSLWSRLLRILKTKKIVIKLENRNG